MNLIDQARDHWRQQQERRDLNKHLEKLKREFDQHSKGIKKMDTPEEDATFTSTPKVTEKDVMDAEKSFQFWSGFFTALEDRERDSTEIGQQAIAAARQVLREKYEELCRLTIKFSEQ